MKIKLLASTILASCMINTAAFSASSAWVVGYWSDWGIYWPERPYPVSGSHGGNGTLIQNPDFDSQMEKLSVVNFAFMEVDENGHLYFNDPWADLGPEDADFCKKNLPICQNQIPAYGRANFSALIKQKALHPNLRVQISIGGWYHMNTFEKGAFVHQDEFIASLKALVEHYQFDGVDLDYEPWEASTFNSTNSAQLVQLAQAIHHALPNLKITIATSANPNLIKAFDDGDRHNWQALAKVVDFISIMGYDMHGDFDYPALTGLQSALYFDAKEPTDPSYPHFSDDQAVQAFLNAGVPANQLVLGIPSYAHAYGGVPGTDGGLFQSFTTKVVGDLTDPNTKDGIGMHSYYGIMKHWLKEGFSEHVSMANGQVSAAWAYNPATGIFASYDNTAVIDSKVNYIQQKGLGGIMMWELRTDLPANEDASLLKHMAKVRE